MRLATLILLSWTLLPLTARAEEMPAAEPAFAADVTIVSSRRNQKALEKKQIEYREGIKFWVSVCQAAGLSYRIAGDYETETGLQRSRLYIIHRAEILTDAQRANLVSLQQTDAAVLHVGLTGRLNPTGQVRPALPVEPLELANVRDYTPTDNAYFVTAAPGLLSLGNDPGFRFEFDWEQTHTLASTPHAAAYSVDWSLFPYPEGASFQANAVAAVRTLGKTRLAWLGVAPDSMSQAPEQQDFLVSSLVPLVRWMAREPVAAPCHWQGCKTSSAVVTADVEDQFQTGDAIALACHKEGIKGSFFLVGSLAPDYPEVVAALAENGEVGTHSVHHGSFKGRTVEDQLSELQQGKLALEKLGVMHVVGFRPPMEEYDQNTLRAVALAGLGYVYGNLAYDRSYPIVRKVSGQTIYQFARIVADDYNLVVQRGVKTPEEYRQEYLKEYLRMHTMGGIFPFSFHTNYLGLKESVDVVRAMVHDIKKESTWVTTFGDIVQWLELRRLVTVNTTSDRGVVTLTVTSTAPVAVSAFPIRYFAPDGHPEVELVATPTSGLTIRPKADGEGTVLLVDLKPGETKTIQLR